MLTEALLGGTPCRLARSLAPGPIVVIGRKLISSQGARVRYTEIGESPIEYRKRIEFKTPSDFSWDLASACRTPTVQF